MLTFASRGFVGLTLAFYGVDDLPSTINSLDLEYFEEAVDYLLARPEVSTEEGVGLWGISSGGSMALSAAAFLGSKVKAVVVNNCFTKLYGIDLE